MEILELGHVRSADASGRASSSFHTWAPLPKQPGSPWGITFPQRVRAGYGRRLNAWRDGPLV